MTRHAALAALACALAACAPAAVTASVNQPPVPVLSVQASAATGEAAHIDGSASTDLDGTVANGFILFGDGTDPYVAGPSDPLATDHAWTAPGLYLVELYIDDDKAATARARFRIQITP